MENKKGQTAQALFTSEHKELRKEGEKWMKDTATSYTLVAALIATVMFAAAFTESGGFNNDGDPVYLHSNSLIIFVLSDALSLFSSASSILTFLGILKSVYAEDDFLVSLPWKLIRGFFTLVLSIVTMMLAFATTILIIMDFHSHRCILAFQLSFLYFLKLRSLTRFVFQRIDPASLKDPKKPSF